MEFSLHSAEHCRAPGFLNVPNQRCVRLARIRCIWLVRRRLARFSFSSLLTFF